jgi:hypothetical protein
MQGPDKHSNLCLFLREKIVQKVVFQKESIWKDLFQKKYINREKLNFSDGDKMTHKSK